MPLTESEEKTNKPKETNVWDMLRDVLINATNRGQLLAAMLGFIIMLYVFELKSDDLYKLSLRILEMVEEVYVVGWVLCIILIPTFVIYYRRTRTILNRRIDELIEANHKQKLEIDQMKSLPPNRKSKS